MPNIVEILVVAKNETMAGFSSAKKDSQGLAGALTKAGEASGLALAGIAVESVKMATTYESSTQRLVTSAGESLANLDMVRKGMLDMAGQVGVSADDLSQAMYYVESAGFHGAAGLTALKAAAQGAKAEGADTTTVVKAMTDVLVDYHLGADQAAKVTSQMITAVAHGKTSLQDFSGAFASIVPAASAAGISFNDVAGALAEMTNHGFTANRASQNLAQALRSLLNPTGPMTKAFVEFGVSSQTLREKLQGPNGLTDAMQYLSQAATKAGKEGTPAFAAALKLLMGTAPGANAALATVGANFKDTSAAITAIGGASADAQGNVQGFAEIQGTLGQKVAELKASFDSLMIELGQKLIPVIKDVADWMLKHKDTVVLLLAVLGSLMAALTTYTLITKTVEMVTKAWAAATWLVNAALDADPIVLIIMAIVALGVAIYELITHWKTVWADIKKWAEDAWKFIYNGFGKYLLVFLGPVGLIVLAAIEVSKHWKQIWGDIKQVASDLWQWLWNDFGKKIWDFFVNTIPKWFDAAVHGIESAWNSIYNTIVSPFVNAYNDVMNFLNQLVNYIENIPGKIAGAIKSIPGVGAIASFFGMAHGGIVGAASGMERSGLTLVGEQGPELVRLPYGSTVRSNPDTMSALTGASGARGMKIELEWVAGNATDEFMTWLRRSIRVRYGSDPNSVQKALGQNF